MHRASKAGTARPAFVLALALFLLSGCGESPSEPSHPPDQSALVIPRLEPAPDVDGHLGVVEWSQALHLSGQLQIGNASPAQGAYPFDLHVGHSGHYLYIGLEIREVGRNPFSNSTSSYADAAMVFLDAAGIGAPSDEGFMLYVSTFWHKGGSIMDELRPIPGNWELQDESEADFEWDDGPVAGNFGQAGYGDESLSWEIVVEKAPSRDQAARVDVGNGETFVLAVGFERQCGEYPIPDPPGELDRADFDIAPTPGPSLDAHQRRDTWWRMRLGEPA